MGLSRALCVQAAVRANRSIMWGNAPGDKSSDCAGRAACLEPKQAACKSQSGVRGGSLRLLSDGSDV